MAPHIKTQLEAVGANVTVRVDDSGAYMEGKGFDLLLWAQHTLPAGDPNWFLETFFYSQDAPILGSWMSQNFALLSSSAIDSALDDLRNAEGDARKAAAKTAHKKIIDEVPATFLTSPTWHVGVRERLKSYEPWGSDYYVIKADMGDTVAAAGGSANLGLYVAIGVLAAVSVLALGTAIAYKMMMNKMVAVQGKATKSEPATTGSAA